MEKLIEQTQRQQQGNSKTIEIDATQPRDHFLVHIVILVEKPGKVTILFLQIMDLVAVLGKFFDERMVFYIHVRSPLFDTPKT